MMNGFATRKKNGAPRRMSLTAQSGQALVPVIFVMLILTVVGVAFSVSSHHSAQASGNYVAGMQRYYVAHGALNYAMTALAQTSNNGATYGIVPPLPDTDSNGWAQMGDTWVKVEAIDTGSCLNLNTVTQAQLQVLPVFQDNSDLAAAVLQWRTSTSSTSTTSGTSGTSSTGSASSSSSSSSATTDPYQSLTPSYSIKGGNFDSVEELLLIQGMSPTILYGSAAGTPISPQDAENNPPTANTTTVTGSGSSASASTTTGTTTAAAKQEDFTDVYTGSTLVLADLFTTVGRERNVGTDGTPRLNMNTATAQQMTSQLGLTTQQANAVVQYRTRQNTTTTPAAATPRTQATTITVSPAATNTRDAEAFESRQAAAVARPSTPAAASTPTGTGTTGTTGAARPGGTTATTSTAFKTIADLLATTAFTRTVMQTAAGKVSVDDKVFHDNLVNINTAPPEVLAMVPGMTHNILSEILAFRQGGQTFQDMGDFFSLTNLQRSDFQAVVASLTTKTSTYYVHIKVRTSGQQSVYAVSALVEMTDAGPHLLQWREVPRTPGWSTWLKPLTLQAPTPGQNSTGATAATN